MKRLLKGAWRVVTGKSRNRSRLFSNADPTAAFLTAAELSADAAFDEAFAIHQAGRIPEAQAAYRRILDGAPEHAQTVHFLGITYGQAGDFAEAERLLRRSIQIHESSQFYDNLAFALGQQGKWEEVITAYRDALRLSPENAPMHGKLGDVLVAQMQFADAELAFRRALELQADDPDVYFKHGIVLGELKRYAEAVDAYQTALSLRSGWPDAYNNLGVQLTSLHLYREAEDAYRQALSLQPETVAAHCNLGQLLQQVGRCAEAEASYRRALEMQPDDADAQNKLGSVLMTMFRYPEAEVAFRAAQSLNPEFIEAWGNLGIVLAAIGRYGESEAAYQRALALNPDNPVVLHNLASLYCKLGRDSEAEAAFRGALLLDPSYAEAYSNLAILLQNGGRSPEAEPLHRKAVALKSESAVIHFNFGQFLYEIQRYSEAESSLSNALSLQPDLVEAHNILGNLCKETGRYADAEVAYSQALKLDSQLDWARYNIALLYLSQKRFKEGWEGYERRWSIQSFDSAPRPFMQEQWRGEVSRVEALLVWQEQGIGDIVLYSAMVPDLIAQDMPVVVECEARVVPLFARSFPRANVVVRSDPPDVATTRPRWQSPFGSLCRWLRVREEDFRWRGPYLVPDAEKTRGFQNKYRALGQGPIVGISWRSQSGKMGSKKSMPLSEWRALLALGGATFVSLQYGDCEEEVKHLKRAGINLHLDRSVDSLKDIDSFASQVAAMDLVISVSNTTVHFAGALGVPVWTLLPSGGQALLWYWGNDGGTNLWYPTMRIFRQDNPGDWAGVVDRVEEAFRSFLVTFKQV